MLDDILEGSMLGETISAEKVAGLMQYSQASLQSFENCILRCLNLPPVTAQ